MKYRRFGKTEMMLSQLSLGCMRFTGDSPEEDAIGTVEHAVACGTNHIETARGYGNSEELIGKALKRIFKQIPRKDLYITTKICPSSNVDEFKANFELSMNSLGLDYLDNLDFHGPGDVTSIRPAMLKLTSTWLLEADNVGFSTRSARPAAMMRISRGTSGFW